jgi:hypothetical protein
LNISEEKKVKKYLEDNFQNRTDLTAKLETPPPEDARDRFYETQFSDKKIRTNFSVQFRPKTADKCASDNFGLFLWHKTTMKTNIGQLLAI